MDHNKKIVNLAMSPLAADNKEQVQESEVKPSYKQGRLKNVTMNNIRRAKKVVYGLLLVGPASARVLFDPSASHSFISSQYAEDQKILKLANKTPVMVQYPGGLMKADQGCPKAPPQPAPVHVPAVSRDAPEHPQLLCRRQPCGSAVSGPLLPQRLRWVSQLCRVRPVAAQLGRAPSHPYVQAAAVQFFFSCCT